MYPFGQANVPSGVHVPQVGNSCATMQQNERRSRLALYLTSSEMVQRLPADVMVLYIFPRFTIFYCQVFFILKFLIISMFLRQTDYSQLFRFSVFAPSLTGSQHRRSVRKRRKAVKPSSTSEQLISHDALLVLRIERL